MHHARVLLLVDKACVRLLHLMFDLSLFRALIMTASTYPPCILHPVYAL